MKLNREYELRSDRLIALKSGYKSLKSEALKIVDYEIKKSKTNRSPFDIDRFKNYLGVKDIRDAELYSMMKGRLIDEGDSFAIEVSKDLKAFLRKKAILHEFAHIILDDTLSARINLQRCNIKTFSNNIQPKILEKLCDAAADEMLLSKMTLRQKTRGNKPSLKHLYEISRNYEYPLEFVASRALNSTSWRFRILWWKFKNNKAIVFNSIPSMDEFALTDIRLINGNNSIVIKSYSFNKYIEGKQKIVINNVEDEYRVNVLPEKKDIVICMLIYL